MSTIIRLQGLPAIADSVDIRQFFCGLNIPKGGVFITGGKYGEAFIIFATREDSQCALCLSGRPLKNSYVLLIPSTEGEMQRALEIYRLGMKQSMSTLHFPSAIMGPSYLYVHGMPSRTTTVEIRDFFKGLIVLDVLFLKFSNGVRNGNAIIKFDKMADAGEALRYNNLCLCGSPVALKLSDEKEWLGNGGSISGKKRSRSRTPRRRRRTRSRSRSRRSRSRSRSRWLRYRSRYSRSRSRTRRSRSSSRSRRDRHRSPYTREFYVHIINLSYKAEKRDLKKLFYNLDMSDSQITFLLDKDGKRTREAFAMFTTQKDYKRAVSLDQEKFMDNTITILPISKKHMLELIDRMKTRVTKDHPDAKKSGSRGSPEKRYIYLRNFASSVTKADVRKFFSGFSVKDDDITLLLDEQGVGLGEALIKFANDKAASKTEKLNRQKYLGTEILLSRISESQIKAFNKGTSVIYSVTQNSDEMSLVTQADDVPDVPIEPVANADSGSKAAVVDSSESKPELESKEVENSSDAKESAEPVSSNTEDTALENDKDVTDDATNLEDPKTEDVLESPDVNDPVDEPPVEAELQSANEEHDCREELAYETNVTASSGVTLLFMRNLPCTVTVAEILDFFHGYKMSSVNLKNIERGIATVRMPNYTEAVSAINALNKKEIGSKQVFLSLI